MKKVLIIIPAYNEELNIKNTVDNLKKLKLSKKHKLDYMVINDGSKDNTQKICIDNNINVISLVNNLGIGGAVQTGYKYAYYNDYDIAIQFDGDGQHDPKYIPHLINEIENGYNMVIGSRFIENLSKFKSTATRQLGIKILSLCIKIFGGIKIYDPTSGFRAVDKNGIKIFANKYPIEYPEPSSSVDLIKMGLTIKEIPVEMHEREFGKSSINLSKSVYYMVSVCIAIMVAGLKKGEKLHE